MFKGNDRDGLCWSPRPFGYCGCSAQEVTADTAEAPLKGWGGVIAECTLCALDGEGRAHPGVLAGQFLPQDFLMLPWRTMPGQRQSIFHSSVELVSPSKGREPQCPLTHFTLFLSVTQASCSDPFSPCL